MGSIKSTKTAAFFVAVLCLNTGNAVEFISNNPVFDIVDSRPDPPASSNVLHLNRLAKRTYFGQFLFDIMHQDGREHNWQRLSGNMVTDIATSKPLNMASR